MDAVNWIDYGNGIYLLYFEFENSCWNHRTWIVREDVLLPSGFKFS